MEKKKAKASTPKYPDPTQSIMGCAPSCPFFPRSVGRPIDWVYDDDCPWIKRRSKPKKFICQYDGSVIKSWTDQPCPKKLDELAVNISN